MSLGSNGLITGGLYHFRRPILCKSHLNDKNYTLQQPSTKKKYRLTHVYQQRKFTPLGEDYSFHDPTNDVLQFVEEKTRPRKRNIDPKDTFFVNVGLLRSDNLPLLMDE